MRNEVHDHSEQESTLGLLDAVLDRAFVGTVLFDHHAVSAVDETGKETHQDRHAQEGTHIDGDLCRHNCDMLLFLFAGICWLFLVARKGRWDINE